MGRAGVVYKIDMEKTYDHVNWSFLDEVMQKMGFGQRQRNWIKICVSSPSFSVLINGIPKGFFKGSLGLRQGDPLSPYLFIIVVELLSKWVRKSELAGLLDGFSPRDGGPKISFIQSTDDSLFLLDTNAEYIRNLRCILLLMETVSSLKVNLRKFKILPVGIISNMEELTDHGL